MYHWRADKSSPAGHLNAWRRSAQTASGALVMVAVMLLASAAQARLRVCPAPTGTPSIGQITECCQITKRGNYAVKTVSGTLNASGTCIKIVAPGVVLNGNGQTIFGNAKGIGIRLLPTAVGDVVYNVAYVRNFKIGVLDDAPRSVITNDFKGGPGGGAMVTVESNAENGIVIRANHVYVANVGSYDNGANGVLVRPLAPASVVSGLYLNTVEASTNNEAGFSLKSLDGSTLSNVIANGNGKDGLLTVRGKDEDIEHGDAENNKGSGIHLKLTTASHLRATTGSFNAGAGIWIEASSGINVGNANAQYNGTADVYIGCSSAQEPDGTRCASLGLPASNGNRVVDGDFISDSDPTYPMPDVGIGIDRGNHHNVVLQNSAQLDTKKDMVDENTNCDSNLWMLNSFSLASSLCIH